MAANGTWRGGAGVCRGLLARVVGDRHRWRVAATGSALAAAVLATLGSLGVILVASVLLDGMTGALWPALALSCAIGLALGGALLGNLLGGGLALGIWAARRLSDDDLAERLRTAVELAQLDVTPTDESARPSPRLVEAAVAAAEDGLEALTVAVSQARRHSRRLALWSGVMVAAHLLVLSWAPQAWTALKNDDSARPERRMLEVGTLVDDVMIRVEPPAYARDALPIEEMAVAETTVLRGSRLTLRARPLPGYDETTVEVVQEDRPDERGEAIASAAQAPTPGADGWLSWQYLADVELVYRYVAQDAEGRPIRERGLRRIQVRADHPPTAHLVAPTGEIEVRSGDQVVVEGVAEDDLGLSGLELVISAPGGGGERRAIALQPGERRGELRESVEVDRLGLRPGEFASVHVEAADNNGLEGSRRTASDRLLLRMFSPEQHHAGLLDLLAEVAMEWTLRLADRLERDPSQRVEARIATLLAARQMMADAETRALAELSRLRRELGDDVLSRSTTAADLAEIEQILSDRMADDARAAQRIEEALMERPEGHHELVLRRQHDRMVAAEERAVLLIASLAMAEHRSAMARDGRELAQAERALDKAMAALSAAPDAAGRAEAERLLDAVQAQLERMMQSAAKQMRIVPPEHVNPGALEPRGMHSAMRSHRDALREIRARLRDGRFEDALTALRRLRDRTEKMMQELRQHAESKHAGDDAALARLVRRLRSGVTEARTGQANLREGLRPDAELQARQGADHLRRNLQTVLPQVRALLDDARDQVRPQRLATPAMGSNRAIARVRSALSTARSAVDERQVDAALQALVEAEERLAVADGALADSTAEGDLDAELRMRDQDRLRNAADRIGRASVLLREALPAPSELLEPKTRRRVVNQTHAQDRLRRRLAQIRQRLKHEGAAHPALQRQVGARLDHAMQMMRQSAGSLQDSDASRALEQMGETLDALDRANDLLRDPTPEQVARPEGVMGLGAGPADGPVQLRSGNSSDQSQDFRRRVLEAMQQQAPGAYRERLKRYYEEIVR